MSIIRVTYVDDLGNRFTIKRRDVTNISLTMAQIADVLNDHRDDHASDPDPLDAPHGPESAVDEQEHPEDPDAVQERPAGARHAVDPTQNELSPRSGTVNDTSQKKPCGAASEHIAGGNACVLDQGHTDQHVSFMNGQSYFWDSSRLRG